MESIYTKRLDAYLNPTNLTSYAVLINGKWGSGKTHFIKNYATKDKLNNLNAEYEVPSKACFILFKMIRQKINDKLLNRFRKNKRNGKKGVYKKFVYVSLGGLNSIDDLNKSIIQEMYPFLKKKSFKITSGVFKSFLKFDFNLPFSAGLPDESNGLLGLNTEKFENLHELFGENAGCIYIFDDLERTKIDINVLMGYISELVTIEHKKVILLANLNDWGVKRKFFNKYQEKIIGFRLEIEPNYDSVFNSLIHRFNFGKYLIEQKNNIYELFLNSNTDNLRLIEHFFESYNSFLGEIDQVSFICENKEYFDFQTKLYFSLFILKKVKMEEEDFSEETDYIMIYDSVLGKRLKDEFNINLQGNENLLLLFIRNYLTNHLFSLPDFNSIIHYHKSFWKNNMPDWLRLWYFNELEDNEFDILVERIQNQLNNQKIEQIAVLIQLLGMFTKLNSMNKVEKNNIPLLNTFISYFNRLVNNKSFILNDNLFYSSFNDVQILGYGIYEYNSENVRRFLEHIRTTITSLINEERKRKYGLLSDLIETDINEFARLINTEKDFESISKSSDPGVQLRSVFYIDEHPVFEGKDPFKVIEQIKKISNANLRIILSFFTTRYTTRPFVYQSEMAFCLKMAREIENYLDQIKSYKTSHFLLEGLKFVFENGKGRS